MTHRNLSMRKADPPRDWEAPRVVESARLVDELGRVVLDDISPWLIALIAAGRDNT